MKKNLFLFLIVILLSSIESKGSDKSQLFKISQQELCDFELFKASENLIAKNNLSLAEYNSYTQNMPLLQLHDGPLAIPSFWFAVIGSSASCLFPGLGCIGGPAAAFYIKSQTDDEQEIKKAWQGCFVGNAVTTLPYVAFVAFFFLY